MRAVARHKKARTKISQRSLSKILRLLSKTYPIPWIEVLSEKSSVVFSKVAFPLILALILPLVKEGAGQKWTKAGPNH